MKWLILGIVVSGLLLFLGTFEWGQDNKGPYKASLLLKKPDGSVVPFYLGGHSTLSKCTDALNYEAKMSPTTLEFWTTPDYSYGGKEQNGWIENHIVGIVCKEVK